MKIEQCTYFAPKIVLPEPKVKGCIFEYATKIYVVSLIDSPCFF